MIYFVYSFLHADGSSGIEEEYAHAIATNIAHELLNQMKKDNKETEIVPPSEDSKDPESKISEGRDSGEENTDSNKTAEVSVDEIK